MEGRVIYISTVELEKQGKHASICRSHGFDFSPIGFLVLGSLRPAVGEPPDRIV